MRSIVMAGVIAVTTGLTAASAQGVLIVPYSGHAERGYDTVHESKAVLAGQEARLWWAQMIDPDCSPHGSMITEVIVPPQHGSVRLSDDAFFPNFPAQNPRSVCDTKKVPGKRAFYTAQSGYKGDDRMVLQNSTSEGRIRKIVVEIEVH